MKLLPAFSALLLSYCITHLASARPVDLSPPVNTLGAADPYGRLRIWREIDHVTFGDNQSLPFRIGFLGSPDVKSPYLGRGWQLPLLESKAFLKRETMLEVLLPCGKVMYLRRDKKDQSKFQTLDKEWTAEINGEDTIISRADGWQIRYRRGAILDLKTDTNRRLSWIRINGLVSEIREEPTAIPLLKCIPAENGFASSIVINGKSYRIGLDKRPRIEASGIGNIVAGFDATLSALYWPDRSQESYIFSAEQKKNLASALEVVDRTKKSSTYTWNPTSGFLLSEEEWNYDVSEGSGKFDPPYISRRNSLGQIEFVRIDQKNGLSEVQTQKAGHLITESFTSPGPLYGKVRKITRVEDNGTKLPHYSASYDESGHLLRETDSSGFTSVYQLDANGSTISRRIVAPSRPETLEKLVLEEKAYIEKLSQFEGESKASKLQELAYFYIYQLKDTKKAYALASELSDRKLAYKIKVLSVNHNPNYGYSDKIAEYKQLAMEFPENKRLLDALVTSSQNALARNKTW